MIQSPISVGELESRKHTFPKESPSNSRSSVAMTTRSCSPFARPPSNSPTPGQHSRHQSSPPFSEPVMAPFQLLRPRSYSNRGAQQSSGTFAPQFITSESPRRPEKLDRGIEGENDFSGKRYVWLKDPEKAFVKGHVVDEMDGNMLLVQCDDETQRHVAADTVEKVNPAKFDKADDMAELTHLNEASVIHNLHERYQTDLIYTYSGLFLVTVNPYCPLPIYTNDYIRMHRSQSKEETKPHIFAMANCAFENLIDEGQNQSILVTGESGAGKTENTKKVIQYLAAVASSQSSKHKVRDQRLVDLSEQILRANPILESFGNAQTVRNNNSSRFGKFIRIEFTRKGQIAAAHIDWYLLEKSRVARLNPRERNYHIFYQLLKGADARLKDRFGIRNFDVADFAYTRNGNDIITGVSDATEWNTLCEAFQVMGFADDEQFNVFQTIIAILFLGNVEVVKESMRADQAALSSESRSWASRASELLGIDVDAFVKGLLHPRVRAGREWVEKVQTPEQVRSSIDALAKGIYERAFGDLVTRINRQLQQNCSTLEDSHFIGVLDIAGFEIFENNSFEQLCINYTNEKLQQFFNHHMFVLEQEEYAREHIEWKFIDFGKDLQPTIDLIELPNPIGIFSCLDEDSVMPKATDMTFTDKMHGLWSGKSSKYRPSRLSQGFMLTHYAAEVEYSTDGWLEKNKDPLNDNLTRLLAASANLHIKELFHDCGDLDDDNAVPKSRVKKGLFRTVAQRHKEQLSSLMAQLHETHPHFVRCILPNHKKRPKQFHAPLVLDQLRCNGVLEGIRIARTGFPNRLLFTEFRQRYEVLCPSMPSGYLEGQKAVLFMLENIGLDRGIYRVGLTKVFFRAGVLADLEEQRDDLIKRIVCNFQSVTRGYIQRKIASKRLYRAEASRILQQNFSLYLKLRENPWWRLFVHMRPLLAASQTAHEVRKRDEAIQRLEVSVQQAHKERSQLEEERRKAELDIQRVQQVLESERSLALDKEEIFKRLQRRELELTEKLTDAIDDQEKLEDQLDDLVAANKKTQNESEAWRLKLDQASHIIERLESEKKALHVRTQDLDDRIGNNEQIRIKSVEREEQLSQETRMLQSQLQLQQRKLAEAEAKLLSTDQNSDEKIAALNKELQLSRNKASELREGQSSLEAQVKELSATSSGYEDMLRRKESELAILKTDQKDFAAQRKSLELEKSGMATRFENLQTRVRDVQAEVDVVRAQKSQIEKEAIETKKILEAKLSEDLQAGKSRQLLQSQVEELKSELFQLRADLSRERQSRDDVRTLSEHQLSTLRGEYDRLNEAKITIEKEMYIQEDSLRRAVEAKAAAERSRKDLQAELMKIRERYAHAESLRIETQSTAERSTSKQASERLASLRKELENKDRYAEEIAADRSRLVEEVHSLKQLINDSENFKLQHDQHKDRVERELVTVKGRLMASENDNRALLNKIQQKNLDIARSTSRAGENLRSRVNQLQSDKARLEQETKALGQSQSQAQLSIASLEKSKEKLALDLEDLHHELDQAHKQNRGAEKSSSSIQAQLHEATRSLESEKQLRHQAQANTRKLQSMLDSANVEIKDSHQQLTLLHKVFYPESMDRNASWEKIAPRLPHYTDLAGQLEACQQALRVTNEKCSRAESQIQSMRRRYEEELHEADARFSSSKRQMLEELNPNTVHSRSSPKPVRKSSQSRQNSSPSTPIRQHLSTHSHDSNRSDRTMDTVAYHKRMDVAAELELVQNQLQLTEMQNRHLQNQLGRLSPQKESWLDESPSARRVHKLERENGRLHERLDDSAKKVSSLEKSIRSGDLSLRDVQAKSHEELYSLINSQEDSRRDLLHTYNETIGELSDAKSQVEGLRHTKVTLEVELRDAKSETHEATEAHEHEAAERSQLLSDYSDLQIRFDAESSRAQDLESSLQLYKVRADDYFNKLEQAEITILKASRAEQNARAQAHESEETYASVIAERKQMESLIDDLQRQSQSHEARVEDLCADLDGAIQAKRRLQQDLDDYRSQRAMDVEDKEATLDQTRRKYQNEFATLSNELEIERENVIHARSETSRMRDELEELRSKWDDEVLNSSAWSKEKARLEMTLSDLSASRDEAASAHSDAQSKIVSLLTQVRNLRTSIDDTVLERDNLQAEKRSLESRLKETSERLEDLSRGESPSLRNAAGMDREVLDLKSQLAQQQDIAMAAVGKMRKADALTTELQKDIVAERENNVGLQKEKAAQDKVVKVLQGRVVELEAKGFPSASQDVRFLNGRVQELEHQLENFEADHANSLRSVRSVDRTVKDLQSQLDRREKTVKQLSDDVTRGRDKVERLLANIDELQAEDARSQLAARRAERDLREEREKGLRLERELQGWKGLRLERRSSRAGSGSEWGGSIRGRGHRQTDSETTNGLDRTASTTKGFL